ncbi:MAG: PEP-CTERM sorting domain-containing protein [Bryobacteraceae bacterium]|nr:PEP-CTERM sorting domain-containing protein [Bryobacteraceae bacterium]
MRLHTFDWRTGRVLLTFLTTVMAASAGTISVACTPTNNAITGGNGTASFTCPGLTAPSGFQIASVNVGFQGSFTYSDTVSPSQAVSMTFDAPTLGFPPKTVSLTGDNVAVGSTTAGFVSTTGLASFPSFTVGLTSTVTSGVVDESLGNVRATYCYDVTAPTPLCPVLPTSGSSGSWTFGGASGLWYDPPTTSSYDYAGTAGTTFTRIRLVTGFAAVNVLYGPGFGTSLGSFAGGSTVDFVALTGSALSAFRISGINPSVDAADPNAYPLQMFFSSPSGTFTQTAVPEPSTVSLFLAGAMAARWLKAKRI